MGKKVVVLGGGTGGAVVASRLSKILKDEIKNQKLELYLIDKNPLHEFRPSYLWVAVGTREPNEITRPLSKLKEKGINVINSEVKEIIPEKNKVLFDGQELEYDYLVVSLGTVLKPEKISGIEKTFHAWEMKDALKLREALGNFRGGRVVVGPAEPVYRCSPAPFELAFMIRYISEQRGFSEKTEITVIHPWDEPMQPFGPFMVNAFKMFLNQFNVKFVGGFWTEKIKDGKIQAKDGREIEFDLSIIIPPHQPAYPVFKNSKLRNDNADGYMLVDKKSLRHPEYKNIFGIGDIISRSLGIGMAGVFAHFQADYVASQIIDEIKGTSMGILYNRTGICVMDVGYMGAGVFCDFSKVIDGAAPYPDCWMLGGMRAFRGLKVAFERMWFSQIFGK